MIETCTNPQMLEQASKLGWAVARLKYSQTLLNNRQENATYVRFQDGEGKPNLVSVNCNMIRGMRRVVFSLYCDLADRDKNLALDIIHKY